MKFVLNQALWDTSDISEIKKKETLSVGFIEVSECVEILTGNRPCQNTDSFPFSVDSELDSKEIPAYSQTPQKPPVS